jgi:hypothetical protein
MRRHPSWPVTLALLLTLATVAGAGCGVDAGGLGPRPSLFPAPVCGGLKILIEDALPCDRVVGIALGALSEKAPAQLARGVTAIDVQLAACPAGEVPPQIDCTGVRFAQLVTVTFGPSPPGGPIEPSLAVAVEPVTGRVLGISNPMIL